MTREETESKPSLCGSRIDVPPGNDSIRDRPNAPGSAAELQLAEESVEELEFLEEINAFITWLRANPAKKKCGNPQKLFVKAYPKPS